MLACSPAAHLRCAVRLKCSVRKIGSQQASSSSIRSVSMSSKSLKISPTGGFAATLDVGFATIWGERRKRCESSALAGGEIQALCAGVDHECAGKFQAMAKRGRQGTPAPPQCRGYGCNDRSNLELATKSTKRRGATGELSKVSSGFAIVVVTLLYCESPLRGGYPPHGQLEPLLPVNSCEGSPQG